MEPLTIVLPLKGRISYTERWMAYANYSEFPFQIIVADGSSDDSAEKLLADPARFSKLAYTYIRYPYDETYSHYYSKIVDALNRVQTPFVALADNDDFFIVDCLSECVRFLQNHPDYVACGGLGGTLWLAPAGADRVQTPLYAKRVNWKCTHNVLSIQGQTARARLHPRYLAGSDVCYYDVKRTDQLRSQFRIVKDFDLSDLFLVEWLVFCLGCIAGKTKRLPRLYLAMQQDSLGGSGEAHIREFGDWLGRMLVESWSEDFSKFVASVSRALVDKDGISEAEAKKHVVSLYRMGIAPSLLSNLLDEPNIGLLSPAISGIIRGIVRRPQSSLLKRVARNLYRRVNAISVETDMVRVLRPGGPGAKRDIKGVLAFLSQQS